MSSSHRQEFLLGILNGHQELVCSGDLIPDLLEQTRFVDPRVVAYIQVFSTNSRFSDFWCTDSRNLKPNLNFVKVQNLNRILRFEVYAHSNGYSVPQNAIVEQRVPRAFFYSLKVEGGFRFPINTLLIHVLRFCCLNPDK